MDEHEETGASKPARDELGRLLPGHTANPNGRPIETEEKKLIKKAVKEIVSEYKETLANALPNIGPVLLKKAIEGDITAIKEVHDRAMGKAEQKTDVTSGGEALQPILVKFLDGKTEDNRDTE
jgi:hypothetical protein